MENKESSHALSAGEHAYHAYFYPGSVYHVLSGQAAAKGVLT